MEFFKRLEDIVSYKKTCICIGLDPRVDPADPGAVAAVIAGNRGLIEATAAYAAAYKPNLAFYEALGWRTGAEPGADVVFFPSCAVCSTV